MKALGEGLRLVNFWSRFFSKKEYKNRVEESLIITADEIISLLSKRKTLPKKLNHYVRQYKANRRKLR